MKKMFNFIPILFVFWMVAPGTAQASDIIGTWKYEVPDAPPEYAQGEITISMDGDEYKAEIKTPNGMISLDEFKVDGNKVSFSVMVEGNDVQVQLSFDGDKMSGKAESYDGVFMMKGERKK